MSAEALEVVVVGGGQAGLAAGFHLARRGLNFVILEAGERIGDSWRKRWESLRLFTPARLNSLPGMPFPDRPTALPAKDEMADYLEAYARRFELPIRLRTQVEALAVEQGQFVLSANEDKFVAAAVVVATGGSPRIPHFAHGLDPQIMQLHSADYRSPTQFRPGDVLIVGAGNSGAEIAMDAAPNHRTWLSGRSTGKAPPILYSRPTWWVANRLITVKTPLGRRLAAAALGRGTPLVRFRERDLAAAGASRVPRVESVDGGMPRLEDGRKLPAANVVWCTGFGRDLRWIQLPGVAPDGWPEHDRGVVQDQPGLYFVGLPFQFGVNSALIDGVGRDAEYVVDRIIRRRSPKRSFVKPD